MKRKLLFITLIFIVFYSCNNNSNKEIKNIESDKLIAKADKKAILEETKKYLISQVKNASISNDKYGNVFIESGVYGDEGYIVYTINKKDIITGDLNGDRCEDAIIKIVASYGGNLANTYNLIWFNSYVDNKYKAFDYLNDVEIKSINNNIIHGIVSKYASNDPQCCPSIKTKVKYQIINNKIVKIKD